MKLTKRVLSLCLALAMLLTVAAFPAFAEESTYTPKTVEVIRSPYIASGDVEVRNPITTDTNQHKSFMPFALSDKDIYVGDTIKIADDLCTANNFKYQGTAVVYVGLRVDRYGTGSTPHQISNKTGATYTFTEPGIYVLRSEYYHNDNGAGGVTNTWYGDGRYGIFEVKDPNAVEEVAVPTTDKTSGDTSASVSQAVINAMGISAFTSETPVVSDFTSTSGVHISGSSATARAGVLLDYTFTLNSVSYVESVSWKAAADNGIYMVDVYGSIDGEDWYLLNEDCVVSPNGLTIATSETTFTAEVDGVAKYVKLANTRWKGECHSKYTKDPSVVGFELGTDDWYYPSNEEEPTTVDVTFVDVTGTNEDVVKTIDAGATVATPDAYATGYKFYADEDCTEEITDLATRTFDADTTIYVKAETTTPETPEEPETPVIDTPKTVTVIRNPYLASGNLEVKPSTPSANAHKSFIPFVLSHKDIYVGDTIKIADDLFTANTFTFEGTKIVYAKMWVQKYPSDNTGRQGIDSQTGTTFTFTEPGIYILRNEHYRLDDGAGGTTYKWYGDGRYDVFEVKDPNAVEAVAKPTTNKTSGTTAASVTQAVVDTMNSSYTSDAVIALDFTSSEMHVSEYGNPGIANATATFAGLVLDLKFTLNSVSYVDSISFVTIKDEGLYMVDVYGSIDGEDWYLLNEDCVVSPNGLNAVSDWADVTLTAEVDGVAKYVKLANPRWKATCLSKYIKTPSVVGFELADGEWGYGSTPEPVVPSIKLENGTVIVEEITDDILKNLPAAYKVDADNNYVITGWTMNGEPVEAAYLATLTAAQVTGDLVPSVVKVPFDVTALTVDATEAGEDADGAFEDGAKYVGGVYLQGAQIRFPANGVLAGLRFVNVVNKDVEDMLLALEAEGTISDVDHGMLAIGNADFSVTDLDIDSAKLVNWGDNIYKTSDLYNDEYYKYTLCVTNFAPEQYEYDITVRSVIKFTYESETVYLYGEQYTTNYKAVVQEAVNVGGLTAEQLEYCNGILG